MTRPDLLYAHPTPAAELASFCGRCRWHQYRVRPQHRAIALYKPSFCKTNPPAKCEVERQPKKRRICKTNTSNGSRDGLSAIDKPNNCETNAPAPSRMERRPITKLEIAKQVRRRRGAGPMPLLIRYPGPLCAVQGPERDQRAIALTLRTLWSYNLAGEVAEWFKAAVLKTAR